MSRCRSFAALEAKLNTLIGLDAAIPAQVGGGVGVGASECGVITASNAVIAAVLPVNVPAVDRASPIIGYFYCGSKPIIPLVSDCVLAAGISLGGKSGYSQGEPCRIEGAR